MVPFPPRAGYRRLEQLAGMDESEIASLHGVGPKALVQLRRALAARTTRAYGRFWSAAEVRPIAVKQTARAWFVTPTTKIRRTLARRQGRELETPGGGAA